MAFVNPPLYTVHVGSTLGLGAFQFAYTLGLGEHGLPELLTTGVVPKETLSKLLRSQADLWLEQGLKMGIARNVVFESAPKGRKPRLMRSSTGLVEATRFLNAFAPDFIRQYGIGPHCVAQFYYPDPRNRLPGEQNYDTRYLQFQFDVVKHK